MLERGGGGGGGGTKDSKSFAMKTETYNLLKKIILMFYNN